MIWVTISFFFIDRQKLKNDINEHFDAEMPSFNETRKNTDNLMKSMKLKAEFLGHLMNSASDFDILSCADHVAAGAENMVSQNKDLTETPRPKVSSMFHLIKKEDLNHHR